MRSAGSERETRLGNCANLTNSSRPPESKPGAKNQEGIYAATNTGAHPVAYDLRCRERGSGDIAKRGPAHGLQNYRTQFDVNAATKLKTWLGWQVSFSDVYITDPPNGLKGNDQVLSTGLRLTFGKGAF